MNRRLKPAAPALAAWLTASSLAAPMTSVAQQMKEVPATPPSQQTGPIISDDDFNAALPALTQDQTQPATQPQTQATQTLTTTPKPQSQPDQAQPATPPAGTPQPQTTPAASPAASGAVTPATNGAPMTSDLPAVAPITDTDLTAPLAPLSGFDSQPLEATNVPAPATPPAINYDTVIDGLPRSQMARFNELSSLKSGKGKALNASMVRARATEDEALALRLLKSEGYFDGTVISTVTTPAKGDGKVQAHLVVSAGKPYRLGEVIIKSGPTTPSDLIRKALPLRTGDQIIADQVLAAEANISVVMPQQGYPFATVGARDITLDPQTYVGDYTLNVTPGNRSRFGGFRSDGDKVFDNRHLAVLRRFKAGDIYDNRKVDDFRQALVATSLFRSVAVEPVKTGTINPDGTEQVDLLVHQTKGPVRALSAQAGYSTGQGFAATGTWTYRNFLPPEGALILSTTLGTQEQDFGVTLKRANAGQRDRTETYSADTSHTKETYEAFTETLAYSVSRVSTPLWQKEWTWSYGASLVATHETTDPDVKKPVYTDYYLTDIPLKIEWDRSNDLLDPTRGFRITTQFTPEAALTGTSPTNFLTIIDASVYQSLSAKLVLAGRIRLGSIVGGSTLDLAPSRRLYSGGGGSVRGFSYEALGPLDSSGSPTGGTSVNEFSIEARYRFGNFGIVPFIDAGQVYDTPMPQFSDIRVGVGVGARMYTNFGPLRIDLATPLSRNKRDVALALYVGIGQAF